MIVCHCNVIACSDIRKAVQGLHDGQPATLVTPGQVFRCCGHRPQCGGCMGNVTSIISDELNRTASR